MADLDTLTNYLQHNEYLCNSESWRASMIPSTDLSAYSI